MSSLKMTFSLTSLIFLIALGLVFVPTSVMAHDLVPGETGAQHVAGTTITDHAAHPVVKSITAPEWANGEEIELTIVFEAANATSGISLPETALTASDITISGASNIEYPNLLPGADLKTQTLKFTIGAELVINTSLSFAAAYENTYVPAAPTTGDDPIARTVMFDNAPPIYSIAVDTDADFTLADGTTNTLVGPFTVLVNITGETATSAPIEEVKISVSTGTATLNPEDGVLSLSNPYFGVFPSDYEAEYRGMVTPAADYDGDLVLSVMVTDAAGNEAVSVPAAPTSFLSVKVEGAPEADATYTSADPAMGTVEAGGEITLTFASDPGTVMASVGEISGSGTTRTLTIPDDQVAGELMVTLTWGNSGRQVLTYMVADPGPLMGLSVPAKSYVIVARTATPDGLPTTAIPANTAEGASTTTIQAWAGMPNLEDLFFRGGSLLLVTSKTKLDRDGKADTATEEAKERDVLITEIMAARNNAKVGQDGYLTHQWIELYNNLPVPVSVTLSHKSGRPVPAAAATEIKLDLVSNVVNPGWNFTGLGADGTDDGDPMTADQQPFVSFYRKERGKDGHTKGHWATSTDTYVANHKGTPGAKERSGSVAVGPTKPSYNVVINEIGNYSDDKYDWIELRNVNQGDGNIKKWQLWEITGDKSKSTILNMPDNDAHKIGAVGDVLLIVATDPYRDPDHPLAAGINITKDNGRLEKTGVTSRYYVAGTGFKLSNSGKTLLLLRSRNDGGAHEDIVDLTGTHFIKDQSDSFATDVWPLKGQSGGNDNYGHGDVVKGADEDFRSGFVYQRINANRGTGKEVWERKGYTGVGYKRSARSSDQHGGTPGYDNGAVKVNEADLSDSATVSISEIMYAKSRNLPQWIELYNSSMTQAVDLAEWKLKIEHSRDADDVDIRIPAVTTNNLGGVMIQPNQTILIVSNTTGRVSDGSQGRIDFPATRVINLWGQKDKLEVDSAKNRLTYRLLSQTAFKITLMDKSGTAVDTVGNLGADGTAMWELPMAEDGEGRSSIIRRYDDGVPRVGTMAPPGDGTGAWVLAADSPLSEVLVNQTYYGSRDDVGTPGYRGGGPLPVSLSKFRPERLKSSEIVVRWITESELNNAGFNILRSETRDGQFTKINTSLIAGQGTTSERTAYEWKDTSAKPNVVYYYQIQDVSLDGKVTTLRQSRLKGDVSPAGKLTTTWGEIKALQ